MDLTRSSGSRPSSVGTLSMADDPRNLNAFRFGTSRIPTDPVLQFRLHVCPGADPLTRSSGSSTRNIAAGLSAFQRILSFRRSASANRCQKGVVSESQLPSVSNVPPKCRDVGSAPKVTVRRSARDGRGAARHFQDPYIWVALGKRRSTVNLRPPPLDPSVSCNGIGKTSC